MRKSKEEMIREYTKVKDNKQYAKCLSVVVCCEAYQALSAKQIAELIDSISDRAMVTNWILDRDFPNLFNPAYTQNGA